jgi:hypothetical protein
MSPPGMAHPRRVLCELKEYNSFIGSQDAARREGKGAL